MPGFLVHKKIGGIVSLILSIVFIIVFHRIIPNNWRTIILIPFIAIVYSQLPDLDSHTSRIRKRAFQFIFWVMLLSSIISIFINVWLMVGLLTFAGMFGLMVLKARHRGPFHTYLFALIISFPLFLVHWSFFVIGFACASSHIFVDRLYSSTKRKVKKIFNIHETKDIIIKF